MVSGIIVPGRILNIFLKDHCFIKKPSFYFLAISDTFVIYGVRVIRHNLELYSPHLIRDWTLGSPAADSAILPPSSRHPPAAPHSCRCALLYCARSLLKFHLGFGCESSQIGPIDRLPTRKCRDKQR